MDPSSEGAIARRAARGPIAEPLPSPDPLAESSVDSPPGLSPDHSGDRLPAPGPSARLAARPADRPFLRNILYFSFIHLLPFGALISGASASVFLVAAAAYWVRIWFVTAGYHCYFSHRAFKTSRVFQFVLAFGAQTSAQGSVLRWATAHRLHHAHADQPGDMHSPVHNSLWFAHMGWLLRTEYHARSQPRVSDLMRFPELTWLDRYSHVPAATLGVAMLIAFGWPGLFIGYGLSTVAVYHATFTVNSLCHRFGTQRYPTGDDSRNNWFVALIMLGGGWHNNHHRYPRSARQGVRWWEIDVTYLVLLALRTTGIVSAIRVAQTTIPPITGTGASQTPEQSHRPY
jgi:stearoyl-CoA desaturase (delta-9 desaturase)